jgi:ligand-binding sensor domain-containing protein/signal transduction histidine kinase
MKYFFSLVFVFAFFLSNGQRYYYKSLSTPEGLTQSQVTAICQDSVGYLWVGTLGGVSRFNGNNFVNYSTDNGLFNNRVTAMELVDGKLYVGHQGGISVFHKDHFTIVELPSSYRTISVTDIVSFNGKVLVATNGAGVFELSKNKLRAVQLLSDDWAFVRKMLVWKGELYFATRSGVLRSHNLKEVDNFLPELDESIAALTIKDNELIITGFFEGLYYYNKEKNKITAHKLTNTGYLLTHTLLDSRGNLWISTSNGVLKYDGYSPVYFDKSKGLPVNVVSLAFEDADKNIWLGTQGKGLVKAATGAVAYYDKSTGLVSDLILCGFQDRNNDYFFGTMDGEIIQTNNFKQFKQYSIGTTIWSAVKQVSGRHWFGTKFGLYSIDGKGKLDFYDQEFNSPGQKITALYRINDNEMYVGGSEGLMKYSFGKFSKIGENGDEIGTIRTILLQNKSILVGTDLGLYQLKNNQFELLGKLNKIVFSLVKTKSGKVYLGAEDGLYELKSSQELERLRFSNDVSSNYINFITVDKEDLLIGTNNGVYIISFSDGQLSSKRVGTSDGVIDPETNLNSSFIDNYGKLWFGTSSGLVQINLKTLNRHSKKSNLRLSSILLDYENFDYFKYEAKMKESLPQDMRFPYYRKNLQFIFDGVSVNNHEGVYFQYKVEGLDESWMPRTKNNTLTLTGLSAGDYVVKARLVLDDRTIADEIQIHFTVAQAFYKTVWFVSLVIFLVGMLVFWLVKLQFKREQAKNRLEIAEFKSRLTTLEQQSLNASMNRHFIFNSLNSIQYFINISDKISANKYLSSFAKLIRKNLDASAENNSMVSLAEEMERIELYLSLEAMRFKDKFDYSIQIIDVDAESVNIPAMMIQPFVENSIIHGVLPQVNKKGEIAILIAQEGEHVKIVVRDNGVGIEKSLENKHGSVGDHKSQGMEITKKRIEILQKISGQNMQIIGPNQTYDEQGMISGTQVEIIIFQNNLDN